MSRLTPAPRRSSSQFEEGLEERQLVQLSADGVGQGVDLRSVGVVPESANFNCLSEEPSVVAGKNSAGIGYPPKTFPDFLPCLRSRHDDQQRC